MGITRLIALNKRTQEIVSVALGNQDWETAYDLLFPGIIQQVRKAYPDFTWYDPDSGYDDDVLSFARALKEVAERAQAFNAIMNNPDQVSIEGIVTQIKALFDELQTRAERMTWDDVIQLNKLRDDENIVKFFKP